MARSSRMAGICAVGVMLIFCVACLGCQNSSSVDPVVEEMVETALQDAGVDTKDVAAVVGGHIITQEQVDTAIDFERAHNHLASDEAWEAYLESAAMTEWDARADIIKKLVDNQLIELVAQDMGIEVTDEEVESYIEPLEGRYPSHRSFLDALEASGYTFESYVDSVRTSLLWDAIQEAKIPTPQPTEDQIREYVRVVAPMLVGRRSSHILISGSDYVTAHDVLDMLKRGADFEELVAEYSIDTGSPDGDQGWDCLNSFVDSYQEALDGLQPGEFSDIVRTRFGYHIILCTDIYTAPLDENGNINIDAIPDELMDTIVASMDRNFAAQMAVDLMAFFEADTPIAVFDENGEQVPNEEIGLAVELSAGVDETADSTLNKVQEDAETGLLLVNPGDSETDITGNLLP